MNRFAWASVREATKLPAFIRTLNERMLGLATLLKNIRWTGAGYAVDAAYLELQELAADPDAPSDARARLYLKDAGSGKTGLYVRFPTGAVQQIDVEP